LSAVLLGLVAQAAADVKTLSQAVLGQQPLWAANRSADIVLDFSKADLNFKHPSLGVIKFRDQEIRVRYHIGYYHGNLAIVRFGTKFVLAVRKMHFYKTLRTQIENYPLSDDKGGVRGSAARVAVVIMQQAGPAVCSLFQPGNWNPNPLSHEVCCGTHI
jgi:hypothetical protein